MKIQEVTFPLGIGVADELRVAVNEGTVYYNLVDTKQTTVMTNGADLQFKILHSNRITPENSQITEEEANNLIVSLLGVTLAEQ